MSSAADVLPDDILELILEDKKIDAVRAVRTQMNMGLIEAKAIVWEAEEDLGLCEDATCGLCKGDGKGRDEATCEGCGGAGTHRVRKAEYRGDWRPKR